MCVNLVSCSHPFHKWGKESCNFSHYSCLLCRYFRHCVITKVGSLSCRNWQGCLWYNFALKLIDIYWKSPFMYLMRIDIMISSDYLIGCWTVGVWFLPQGHPPLTQCPLSEHHFIPRDSLERHMHKCQYAAQGVQSGIEVCYHPYNSDVIVQQETFEGENFRKFRNLWLFVEVFFAKFWGMASFGTAKVSNPRKFSLRKSYFSPIRESLLPQKFSAIQ